MPKGFKRIRYYGVQATKTFAKVKVMIQAALAKVEGVIKGAIKIIARLTYRQRYERRTGQNPWGMATFVSSCRLSSWCRSRCGLNSSHWLAEAGPLLGQPAAPIVAMVIKEPLTAPKPAHPVRHGPLRPPPLAHGVCAYPLA